MKIITITTIFNSSWFLEMIYLFKNVIHHSYVSLPEGSRPCLSRSSRAGSMGLAAAPKAAGGGHREGDPVAAGDGDDSTSKFGMIYY